MKRSTLIRWSAVMMVANTGFTITHTLKKTDQDRTGPETAIARFTVFENGYKLLKTSK